MAKRTIAAFDFDGTLTTRDSLIPFLQFAIGFIPLAFLMVKSIPNLFLYLFGKKDRQEIKEFYLTSALKGVSSSKVNKLGKDFAEKKLDLYLRKNALSKIAWHKNQGHEVILISANLDLYLKPWGEIKKLDKVICSIAEVKEGLVTGNLAGKNCRGEEKLKRLLTWAGPKSGYTLWAYGDSDGDKELLNFSDHPVYRGI